MRGLSGIDWMIEKENFDDSLFLENLKRKLVSGGKRYIIKKRYVNIIDWLINGLGIWTVYQYKRQFQILVEFFGLLCEKCNKKYIGQDFLGLSETLLRQLVLRELDYEKEVFVCRKCGSVVERLPYNELVLCVGMRSGKTTTAAMIGSWVFYMVLNYGDSLDKKFGLVPGQPLRYSMVATAGQQSEKTVWNTFKGMLQNCIDSDVRNIVNNLNVESELSKEVDFDKKKEWNLFGRVDFMSLHSNSGSLAGGTGIGVILEEYSRFLKTDSAKGAQEVYAVLERSLKTVRSLAKTVVDDMFGIMIVVSSPWYVIDDPTLSLLYGSEYRESDLSYGRKIVDKVYGWHLPTWQFNPYLTEKSFEDEKRIDYELFMRDYGAMPVRISERFFDLRMVKECFIEEVPGIVFGDMEYSVGNVLFKSCSVVKVNENVNKYRYYVHVDLSESKDLMSMVFSYLDEKEDIVMVDSICVIEPDSELGKFVYVDTPVLLMNQIKNFSIVEVVTYDKWQSVSGLQKLVSMNIKCGIRSVGYNDFVKFRNMVYQGKVKIKRQSDSVMKLLEDEFNMVRRIGGGKLSHSDVLVSVVGSVLNILDPSYKVKYVGDASQNNAMKNIMYQKLDPIVFRGRWK